MRHLWILFNKEFPVVWIKKLKQDAELLLCWFWWRKKLFFGNQCETVCYADDGNGTKNVKISDISITSTNWKEFFFSVRYMRMGRLSSQFSCCPSHLRKRSMKWNHNFPTSEFITHEYVDGKYLENSREMVEGNPCNMPVQNFNYLLLSQALNGDEVQIITMKNFIVGAKVFGEI